MRCQSASSGLRPTNQRNNCCSGAGPAAGVQSGSCRTPARARPARAARAVSMAGILSVQRTEGGIESIEGLIRQLPNPPDGWQECAPRSTRRRTNSRCAPVDLASRMGSCPIFVEVAWFFSKLLRLRSFKPPCHPCVISSGGTVQLLCVSAPRGAQEPSAATGPSQLLQLPRASVSGHEL